MIHPALFPAILGIAGVFLIFARRLSVSSSRELRRPTIRYVGFGMVAISLSLMIVLGFVKSDIRLFWLVPGGYVLSVLVLFLLSVKREGVTPREPEGEDKAMDWMIRGLIIFFLLMFTVFAFVVTVVLSPIAAIAITIPLVALIIFVAKKKK